MGVSIYAKNSPVELNGSYRMMLVLRIKIAKSIGTEFGEHYANMVSFWYDGRMDEFHKIAEGILSKQGFPTEDRDVIDFMYAPDSDGKITYKTCGKILKLIEDDDEEITLQYGSEGHDWKDFKDLLRYCHSHRLHLWWV